MYYGNIKNFNIADGPGVRVSLYVSGCRNACPGCQNKCTWSFTYGQEYTQETENTLISFLANPVISGFTLCGGEPMEEENQKEIVKLLRRIKKELPKLNI